MNVVVLRRRLFYICAIVALVVPLYFLGNPSVRNDDGSVKSAGGALAKIRAEYDLGQGDLGELDPASESMRLATLGLRGVASTILWQKAEYYKREQYWDRLSATLNNIAVLQPHFIEIWKFQSHNLSYNVSTQFDNYKYRYDWVKKGMNYLVRGSKINKNRTEMPFELGWFFGNKFGVADEKFQYRDLYRNDDNFHADIENRTGVNVAAPEGLGPDRKPDNWLTGRLWYEKSYAMVEQGARPAKSTMMFYRQSPQWLMKHSESIQTDGYLDNEARFAWRRAGEGWQRFGERSIRTSFGDTIFLTEIEQANVDYKEATEAFIEFSSETYERLMKEREASLTPEEREAIELPYAERTFDQVLVAEKALTKLAIDPQEAAREMPPELRVDGMQKAKQLVALREKIQHIEIYRNQINYAYWEQRCLAEQQDSAIAARTNMYEADELLENGLLDEAFEKYETAFENWEKLFNTHPAMMIDDAAEEVAFAVERYRRLLDVPTLAEDFPLSRFLEFREAYEGEFADPAMMSVIASWPKNYPGRSFLDEMLKKSADFKEDIDQQNLEDAQNAADGESTGPEPPEESSGDDSQANNEVSAENSEEKPASADMTEAPSEQSTNSEEAKPEEAKPEDPTPEDPKSEDPKSEDPKSEDPKSEDPKSEDPKSEDPKSEDPKSEGSND
ncbi:MAG: hypothetical protein ACE361_00230 [Aureliella sp.]